MKYKTELGLLCHAILDALDSEPAACFSITLHEYQQKLAELSAAHPLEANVDCSNRLTLPIYVEFPKVENIDDTEKEGEVTKLFDFASSTDFYVNIDDIGLATVRARSPHTATQ